MEKLIMPVLRPIPIKTKGLNPIKALYVWITSRRRWELQKDWFYTLYDNSKIVIPRGFIFDGASVPRIFWVVFAPTGLLFLPSLLHDFAYRNKKLLQVKNKKIVAYKPKASRIYWDKLFKIESIRINGFPIINTLVYTILVLFGWVEWES